MNRRHKHHAKRYQHDLFMPVEETGIVCIELHLLVEVWIKEGVSWHSGIEGSFMAGHLDSIPESLNAKTKDDSRSCLLDPAIAKVRVHIRFSV